MREMLITKTTQSRRITKEDLRKIKNLFLTYTIVPWKLFEMAVPILSSLFTAQTIKRH